VQVIDLLAGHPGQPMSFTDISRRLGLSRATCHAVLTTLTDAGYVLRNEDKTFLLGPSLVAVGRSAEASYPRAPEVRQMIVELVAQTGRSCVLTATNGASLTVLGYEGEPPRGDHVTTGSGVPFAAPFGVVHAAWASDAVVARWVQRGVEMGAGAFERVAELLRGVRERGFSVAPFDKDRRRLWELFALAQRNLVSDDLRQLIARASGPVGHDHLWAEITDLPTVAVSSISSPVFAAPGRVTFALHLEVLDEALPSSELRHLIEQVVATATGASDHLQKG
jgi:DNA-binding IclR family transcriptional regulator